MGSLVQAHPEAQERMCREMRPFLFNQSREVLGDGFNGSRFKVQRTNDDPTANVHRSFLSYQLQIAPKPRFRGKSIYNSSPKLGEVALGQRSVCKMRLL